MADELLNIEDSSLQNIANAIRTKGGTNQPLEFPAGFVSALQAIETDATVTPKIQPQQVTLTKDSTNFPIAAGFHDGTGTVGISLQSKTVTPNDNQQDVVPDAGKLLSEVIVNAVSAGYKMATGTITVSAKSASKTLVPTSCIITVSAAADVSPETGDVLPIVLIAALAAGAFVMFVVLQRKRKNA